MLTKGDKRKIICLIDTDISCPAIGIEEDIKSNILVMRRLHQEEEQAACLIRCTDNKKNPTEVEDVLLLEAGVEQPTNIPTANKLIKIFFIHFPQSIFCTTVF